MTWGDEITRLIGQYLSELDWFKTIWAMICLLLPFFLFWKLRAEPEPEEIGHPCPECVEWCCCYGEPYCAHCEE